MPHVLDHDGLLISEPLPIVIDGRTVRAGQVWLTRTGRKVLTVNLPHYLKGHHIGFVWHDCVDSDVNISDNLYNLETFLFEGDCGKWEDMLTHLQKTSEKS